jgi:hypothetical protein
MSTGGEQREAAQEKKIIKSDFGQNDDWTDEIQKTT